MRGIARTGLVACVALVLTAAAPVSIHGVGQDASALSDAIEHLIRDDLDLDTVTFQIAGTEATLSGRVPTLWIKTQAVDKVLALDGVETVATELTIPEVEDDDEIAQAVGSAIRRYRHNTIWDYVGGSVVDGVVTLTGSVTPDRDKPAELFERVAKISGVQDITLEITRQSSSRRDRDLRTVIAQRVRRHPTFVQYAIVPDSPFRILVDEGVVTLVGSVRSPVEKQVLEQIARQAFEVVRVVNLLQAGG
ncbi:MAG: BON domain-containing protein [Acidobacteria bacterium]|nr:BON domain-containing protein [Acidobacteriota bacterium]